VEISNPEVVKFVFGIKSIHWKLKPLKLSNSLRNFTGSILLLVFISPAVSNGQILKDTASVNMIKRAIDRVYNHEFTEARQILKSIEDSFSGHPVSSLLNGMMIYWENYPLLPASRERKVFEETLHKCMSICDSEHDPGYDAEYLLADLCTRGLLLMFYSDNNLSLEVFPLVLGTYHRIMKSFNYTRICSDFFYFTGIYNYYREVYPDKHPVYKPLAVLIPKGNRTEGIKQLQEASANSIVLRAEALLFISHIFMTYENDYAKSLYYSEELFNLYPANPAYRAEYVINLLISDKYDEAEKLVAFLESQPDSSFFKAQGEILHGVIHEKKYHDLQKAKDLYMSGIKDISLYGDYGNECCAMAYYGLSRISDSEGDKYYRKMYRKKGDELADFKELELNK
jgi:hypothetical protein